MNQAPMKPLADVVQSRGRGQDTQLIHMTPGEVSGLQALAMAHGGSLTINPDTGLPEAGFLSDILPTLAGGLLSFVPGVGPLLAAGIVGLGTGAATGDLGKGLMAGLGAFGGASLGAGLGAGSVFAPAASGAAGVGTAAATAATDAAAQAATQAAASGAGAAGAGAAGAASGIGNVISPEILAQAAAEGGGAALGSTAGTMAAQAPLNAITGAAQQMGGHAALLTPQAGVASMGQLSMPAAGQLAAPAAQAASFPSNFKQFGSQFADAAKGDGGLGALGAGKYGVPAALMGLSMPFMGAGQVFHPPSRTSAVIPASSSISIM